MLREQLLDTSRGRIVALLQHGELTIDDIATKLGLTANAVRVQITGMERDGVVQRRGRRPGTTRPSYIYELTPEVEHLLSRAYVPVLSHLVHVFANGLSTADLNQFMRDAGTGLAAELLVGRPPVGDLKTRVEAASRLMNEHLGAVTRVQSNGSYVIQGVACPLAAVTGKHPAMCLAMESFVSHVVGVPAHECCDRSGRPRCCFEIKQQDITPG